AAPEIARHLADMEAQADLQERILRAAQANDPAAARDATIAGQVDQFRRANPYATDDDMAKAREALVRTSVNAQRQAALSAQTGGDIDARRAAAQAELDDLAAVTDAEGQWIISRENVARRQQRIDEDVCLGAQAPRGLGAGARSTTSWPLGHSPAAPTQRSWSTIFDCGSAALGTPPATRPGRHRR
ncbi:MAG: hypothetical protein H7840_17355, partial [Alphaproteobacteria bacterium]